MSIQCKAAVAWGPKKPLSIETITVDSPKKGEVRIKILFTSVCHTDQYTLEGSDSEATFPCILGHEAAGVVESIGDGVSSLSVGDHVVPLYMPQCYECKFCKSNKSNLCVKIRSTQGKGLMPDGTSRFSLNGQPISHYMGISSFSQYTVVAEISVAKVNREAPLDRICLFGCGLSTGYGAALNTANVQPGDTTAVFGLGAVGLAVVVGCKERGASRIIGIDLNDNKEDAARKFGLTDFVNPKKLKKPLKDTLLGMTDGNFGIDHTFECIGNVDVMRTALETAHRGWGQSIIIGVAKAGEEVSTRPFQIITGRSWRGCAFGGWKSRDDVPRLVDKYMEGGFPLEDFITHTREGIAKINEVFDLLNSGESLRTVVSMS